MENQFEKARTEKRLHELIKENNELESEIQGLRSNLESTRMERDVLRSHIAVLESKVENLINEKGEILKKALEENKLTYLRSTKF